ncbi:MAG: Ig-like domain-containing protein [Longimicrobiales bacterium]
MALALAACEEFPETTDVVTTQPTFRVVIEEDSIRVPAGADTVLAVAVNVSSGGTVQGRLQDAHLTWTPTGYVDGEGRLNVPGPIEGLKLEAHFEDERGSASPDSVIVSAWALVDVVPDQSFRLHAIGETTQLEALARDATGAPQSSWSLNVVWSSADESIATVSEDGVVTAQANGGPVTIRAVTADASDSVGVEVRQRLSRIAGPTATDALQDTLQLNPVDPLDQPYTLGDVRYFSSDPSVVAVDSLSGVAVSVGEGVMEMTAATPEDTCRHSITVEQVVITVAVDPGVDTLRTVGSTVQLAADAMDRNGITDADAAVSWDTRDAGVVTVDGAGLVTAAGPGTTAVVAEAGSAIDSAMITVALAVDSIAIDPAGLTFAALQDTARLAARAFDATGYERTDVPFTWSSTDPAVATVDTGGLVTAVAGGSTQVTATAEDVTAAVQVTVDQVVDTVVVAPAVDTLRALGDTTRLTAEPQDANGYTVPAVAIAWASSDTLVAVVDSGGLVTAVSPGTASIQASDGVNVGAGVVVVDQAVDSLSVAPDSVGFDALGQTAALTVAAFDRGGAPIADPGLAWASSDTLVVTADTGVITAAGNGAAQVTGSADGVSATVKATVEQVVVGVDVAPDSVAIDALGDTTRLSGSAVDANGYPVAGPELTWESADTLVATVDSAGLVQAVANGEAVVRATGGAGTDSAVVTVAQRVDSIGVSPEQMTFASIGDTHEFTAQLLDALGNPVTTGVKPTWSIADTLVATLDTTTLVTVTAAGAGSTTLTAAVDTVTGTAAITVDQVAASVAVSPDSVRLNAIGDTAALAVTVSDENGYAIADPAVTWTSSDTLIARVDTVGRVVAVANGTTAIAAVSDGAVDTVVAIVDQVEAAVVVDPSNLTIDMGTTGQLTAEVQDSNGVVIPGVGVTWNSADETIATVDGGGLVTGIDVGSTTVTASAAGLSGQADVFVALPGLIAAPLAASMNGWGCDLTQTGQAYCWGQNNSGQLGDGTSTTSASPVAVSGGLVFASISTGSDHACGLTPQGEAYCWGGNWDGQLGDNTHDGRSGPTAVTGGYTFKQIVAAGRTTCALDLSGNAYCWGYNGEGQLGYGGGDWDRPYPTAVTGGLLFERLDGGGEHICGLTTAGDLYCWGQGGNGEIGDDTWSDRYEPSLVSGGYAWAQVSAGNRYTCGVTTSGAGYCWGRNDNMQLGHQSGDQGSPGIAVSGALTYQLIEAGGDHTCGILTDGQTVCWGYNDKGRLGTGSTDWAFSSPQLVDTGADFEHLALGWDHSCAMTAAGETWCWGERNDGALGDGVAGSYRSPTRVSTDVPIAEDGLGDPSHFACHIGSDGLVYCAGENWQGQLGDGTNDHRYHLASMATAQTFASVDIGNHSHACGVTPGGEAYCWGGNGNGQLGDGTWDTRNTPTLVAGDLLWQAVAGGGDHSCGVTTGGAVYCWGANWNGQAGQTDTGNNYNTPQLVDDTRTYVDVGAADEHACALTDAGDLYCWGYDNDCVGVLGDGGWCSSTTEPALVQGGLTFAEFRVAHNHVCALTATGEGYCWGDNHRGQLGDGTQNNRNTPVRAGLILFSDIDPGGNHTCGLKTDGTGVCWGGNDRGELGTGSWQDASAPTLLDGSTAFVDIRGAGDTTCGLTAANELYCWGSRRGVFGDGFTHYVPAPVQVIPH